MIYNCATVILLNDFFLDAEVDVQPEQQNQEHEEEEEVTANQSKIGLLTIYLHDHANVLSYNAKQDRFFFLFIHP